MHTATTGMVQSTQPNLSDRNLTVCWPVNPRRSQQQRRLANIRTRTSHQSRQESHVSHAHRCDVHQLMLVHFCGSATGHLLCQAASRQAPATRSLPTGAYIYRMCCPHSIVTSLLSTHNLLSIINLCLVYNNCHLMCRERHTGAEAVPIHLGSADAPALLPICT